MATERQIAANRMNAGRSSGPRSEAGKAASRANALKHGLASENPDVEAQRSPEFQARREAWAEKYGASGETGGWALDRAVAATFRIERCEQAVESAIASTMERARLVWDQDQTLKAAKLGSRLAKNPGLVSRQLEATWHGVNLMVDLWLELDQTLNRGEDWSESECSTALDLLGVPTHLRSGRTPVDDPQSGPSLPYRQQLVVDEVERLAELRDSALAHLDDLERARASSGASALLDPVTKLALRYEREAWATYNESIGFLTNPVTEVEIKPPAEPVSTPAPVATASPVEPVETSATVVESKGQTIHPEANDESVWSELVGSLDDDSNAGTNPISNGSMMTLASAQEGQSKPIEPNDAAALTDL